MVNMGNYGDQDKKRTPYKPYESSEVRLLVPMAALLMRQELDTQKPREGIVNHILKATAENWKISFVFEDGSPVGYEEMIGNIQQDAESENPAHRAFAELVRRSLPELPDNPA